MTTQPGTRKYAAEPADLPSGTLVQLFFDATDQYRREDALLVKEGESWRAISHDEVERRVRHLALALGVLGVDRGDRVAIVSENRPEWAISDYAALCHGALLVPIYQTLLPNQIAYILQDSGARLLFVSTREQLDKVLAVWDTVPSLEHVIVFDDVATEREGVLTLEAALELGEAAESRGAAEGFRERALEAAPDDVATVLYTSGTTGQPKGVMLTHQNIFSNVQAVYRVLDFSKADTSLSFLPLSHILQRMVDFALFGRGVSIAYVSSLDQVAAAMSEVRPTVVVSTPRVYEKLYSRILSATGVKRRLVLWSRRVALEWADRVLAGERPSLGLRLRHRVADRLVFSKVRAAIGGRLRFFVSGAAPLAPELARFFFGAGVTILEGYGLTETSPVTNVNRPDSIRIGTVGPPVPGTEIAIADDGEILVRGPQVMKGYFNLPEATAEAIDSDGWFRTGDIGELDADGYLKITDRKKDLLVTAGGKNIAPQPLENEIKTSRYIAEAVMLGDRRPYPIVLVVPDFDAIAGWAEAKGITERDRVALVRHPDVQAKLEREVERKVESFARYEKPKKVAVLEREFSIEGGELTPTMKVRRRVVEERYAAVIEALYGDSQVAAK